MALWEHFAGKVNVFFTFTGYCGYISVALVFYGMVYLNLVRDDQKISLFFFLGVLWAFLPALFLRFVAQWGIRESILFTLTTGFFLTAALELAAKTFMCSQPYDMAACFAMFTNFSAAVILISRVELYFYDKYKAYSESTCGGKGAGSGAEPQRPHPRFFS